MSITEVIERELAAAMERLVSIHETPDETCARLAADLEAKTGTPWEVIAPDPWTFHARPLVTPDSVVLTLAVSEGPDAAE